MTPEVYQVVVHAGTEVLTEPPAPAAKPACVSAETSAAPRGSPVIRPTRPAATSRRPGDQRLHRADARLRRRPVVDDPTVTAAPCWPWSAAAGAEPRASAAPPANGTTAGAGSRAASPAGSTCTTSSTGASGGRTDLANLVSLCPWHHTSVHDRGYLIAARPGGGGFGFYRPDGTPAAARPALPEPGGRIGDNPDADITPETIIPPWYGERLDLDHAIYVCFANARTDRGKASRPGARPRSRSFGRTRAGDSARWSTTSAGTTTNTRPPDNSVSSPAPPPLYPREE